MVRNSSAPPRFHGALVALNLAIVAVAFGLHYSGAALRGSMNSAETKAGAATKGEGTGRPHACEEGTLWCETTDACVDAARWESRCPGRKCGEGRACPAGMHCTTERPFVTAEGAARGICVRR